MPLYTVTLAARPAGTSQPFENRTLKVRAGVASGAMHAAASQLRAEGLELLPDHREQSFIRMPDGYPDHSAELGN